MKSIFTAVIVTFNSRKYVGNALIELRDMNKKGIAECIVVDNNSSDGTADFIAQNHPWITLVRSDRNVGFGRGCNLGFNQVRTPFVLIHNPDAVLDYRNMQILIEFMESHKKAGIIAPAILEGESTFQSAGLMTTPVSILYSNLGSSNAMPQKREIIPNRDPFQTSWVCGAMMLIRSDLFRLLDGFDSRFFLYFEETDLCRRAVREGSEIWAIGDSIASHIGGASAESTGQIMGTSYITEHFYRSRFYYLVKHFGWVRAVGTEFIVWFLRNLRRWRNKVFKKSILTNNEGKYPFLRFPSHPENLS